MRTNSKQPTMVLESLPVKTRFLLSMEEELMVTDNANADAETVRRTLDQAERTLETSDALSDLAETASRIEEATPGEVELVDRVTQTAVAGTDVDSERIAPAMEQYVGKKIATESIAETARKMLDVVMAFVKKILERMQGFYSQSVVIPAQVKRIDALISHLKNNKGPIAKAVPGENTAEALQVGGAVDLSPNGLLKNLGQLSETFKFVSTAYINAAAARASEVNSAVEHFAPEQAEAITGGLVKTLTSNPFPAIPGAGSESKSKDGSYFVSTGRPLLGNVALTTRRFDTTGGGVVESLERLRKSGIFMESGFDNGGHAGSGGSDYSAEQIVQVLESCKNLLKQLQDFPKSQGYTSLTNESKMLQSASVKLAERMKSVQAEEKSAEDGASVEDQYKALVSFNIGVASWMEQPAMPLYRSAINSVRAVVHTMSQMVGGTEEAKAQ